MATNPEPATPSARAADPIPWSWVLAVTGVGFVFRLIYIMAVHKVGSYLYSDMSGAYQAAQTFSNPNHVLDRWDVAKLRAMGVVGGYLFRQFGRNMLQMWGLLQVILSTATVPLTFIGVHRFLGRRAALVAGTLLALDFLAVGFAGFLMIETYLMFFLALAFACLDPERPLLCLLAGLAIGLGGQFKAQAIPIGVVWTGVLLLWGTMSIIRSSGSVLQAVKAWLFARPRYAAALLVLGVLAIQVPESITTSRILGRPTIFPPYGGQNFFLGHCDVKLLTLDARPNGGYLLSLSAKAVELNAPWPDITFYVSVLDSAFFVREGLKCMRRSWLHTLSWGVEQLFDTLAGVPGRTLDPWPERMDKPVLTRIFNFTLAYVLVPLALYGLWLRRRELGAWMAIGGPLAAIWGLALLFTGNPRYREPFDLFILAGAAVGILAIRDREKAKQLGQGATAGQP